MTWMIISGLIVGALLGFVMQRTRFCLAGGFRDMYVQKSNKMFYALLVAITVQSLGLLIFTSLGIVKVPAHTFPVVGTIVGSFIFGIGIVLAGGCATGMWYRAGEGLIGSWVALILYAITSAITKTGVLLPVMNAINKPLNVNASVSQSTGVPNWVLVLILAIITGIRHYLFERRYHSFIAGIAVGLIALLAWPMSESTGRPYGLGITTPSANLINFLISGNTKFIDWGVLLVLGIFIGSYVAARGSKEFKWRLPDKKTIRNSAIGGILMGFGASVAGGCSIGNGLVETATMSWQGWLGLASMIAGVWFMSYFIFIKPMKKLQQTSSQTSKSKQVSQQTQTT